MDGRDHGVHNKGAHHHERRSEAMLSLLVEKDIVTEGEFQAQIDDLASRTPAVGARVVARAWTDPGFKARLLADLKSAVAELGIDTHAYAPTVALENTHRVHNVVVCTLCSCYPTSLLGVPPQWYKDLSYRSRVVTDPRGVLKEFGLDLEPEVEVCVYDSTADLRYLVVPARPAGTERMTEERLAELVSRDSMIGVARAAVPAE